MAKIKIFSNYHKRDLLYWSDLTEKEQGEFDWISEEEQDFFNFFRYKDWVYCLEDFELAHPDLKALGWDGQHNDTFFSGILVKYPREDWGEVDTDSIIVGWFYVSTLEDN